MCFAKNHFQRGFLIIAANLAGCEEMTDYTIVPQNEKPQIKYRFSILFAEFTAIGESN